jgi:hypothetical protein
MTLPAPHKPNRRLAGAGNAGEAGVGVSPHGDRPSRAEPEPPSGGVLLPFVVRRKICYGAIFLLMFVYLILFRLLWLW